MAGFVAVFDPTAEGTGTQLDISDGAVNNGVGYRLTEIQIEDPANKTTYADSVDTFGSFPSYPHGLGPATINVTLRVGGSSAANLLTKLNALREKLHKCNREPTTFKVTYPSTDVQTWDVVECQPQGQVFDNAFVARNRNVVSFKLVCKPGGRGAEQSLGTFTETTLPVLRAVVSGIKGSLWANGRALITATAGDQWTVFTGNQSRYYDASAHAELFFEAEGRTPLGGAAIAVGSATPSGAGSNVMRQGTLTPVYQAMMSTHALAGTPLQHIGSFEVLARVYRPTTNTGSVSLYLEWGAGDFQTPTKNAPITFGTDSYEGQWLLCKLGTVHIPKLTQGTQKWEGKIVAKSTVAGDDLDIDWIGLCPTMAEGDPACYGEWSGIQRFDTPSSFSARDEFDQTAGALTGKTAPVGGVWIGAGDADDFNVETAGKTAQRTAVSDVGEDAGRYVASGVAAFAAQAVQVNIATTRPVNNAGTLRQAVLARYTDINNWLSFSFVTDTTAFTTRTYLRVRKRVAGTITQIANVEIPNPNWGSWYTLFLLVDAPGRWFACYSQAGTNPGAPVLFGQDSVLATAGALATGKPGFYDVWASGSAVTRNYDNFAAWAPVPDAACYSGQSLEIRHDRAERENSGGTTFNRVSSRNGRYLRFAPGAAEGRSNRFFLKGVRGQQVQTNVWDDPSIDDLAVDLFATPLGVAVPEP